MNFLSETNFMQKMCQKELSEYLTEFCSFPVTIVSSREQLIVAIDGDFFYKVVSQKDDTYAIVKYKIVDPAKG